MNDPAEVLFAQGCTVETQRLSVAYTCLNGEVPTARFPVIRHVNGDDSVSLLVLTPDEGAYLANALTEMLAA